MSMAATRLKEDIEISDDPLVPLKLQRDPVAWNLMPTANDSVIGLHEISLGSRGVALNGEDRKKFNILTRRRD